MSVKNAAPWLVRMSMMVPTLAAPAPACQSNVSEMSPGLIGTLSKAVVHIDQELNAIRVLMAVLQRGQLYGNNHVSSDLSTKVCSPLAIN